MMQFEQEWINGAISLGALWLRENNPARALPHLNSAIAADPGDIPARVNRGEVFIRLENYEGARNDLNYVLNQNIKPESQSVLEKCFTRARALLYTAERFL